ncbi:hypothetical protein TIFTF001_004024 [Ficus carica]|uniref:TF-B3 domain-containing protein n=1 Tax=Ficus carica TaxID=3494 RepID=A0AA87ZGA7_FICCA|nr:hypothetical protein TIFTF001_004024 [Ficus carica]
MARTFSDDNSAGFFHFFVSENNSKHLRIPPAFVRRYLQDLPDKATLEDHCGRYWDVGMVVVENHLCFGTGWKDFLREHCLENGDLLMFKRLCTSVFGVKIFGQKGCKKDVKVIPKILEGANGNEEEEEEEEEEDVKIFGQKGCKKDVKIFWSKRMQEGR